MGILQVNQSNNDGNRGEEGGRMGGAKSRHWRRDQRTIVAAYIIGYDRHWGGVMRPKIVPMKTKDKNMESMHIENMLKTRMKPQMNDSLYISTVKYCNLA